MYFNYTAVTSQNYVRTLTQGVNLSDSRKLTAEYKRTTVQTVGNSTPLSFIASFVRSLYDTQETKDAIKRIGNFKRNLATEAENSAETVHKSEFIRVQSDTVNVEGSAIREILIFIKIVTTAFVRDIFLRRFLVSREEIVLKSCITREIRLESKIN